MRILRQVQPEVPEIIGRIDGLALAAQNDFGNLVMAVCLARDRQKAVETGRGNLFAHRPVEVERFEKSRETVNFLVRRLFVNAIDEFVTLGFQSFCRADVGLNHHLFNEHVRIKAISHPHAEHFAVWRQFDFAFRNIEIERRAF